MSAPTSDPYRLQKLLSRRGFLTLSGLTAGGALLTASPAVAAVAGTRRRRPTSGTLKTAGGSPYHPPYSLAADSVLSEDHFLVKVGKINPAKDKVVAYSRADGQVEAILLQDGYVSQVYRDPAAAGGWNVREIAAGATDIVAGMASDKQKNLYLHVFYRTAANQVRHLQEEPPSSDGTSSGQFTTVETLGWKASGPLQITTDVLRNLLVFSFEPSSAQGKTDAQLRYYWTASGFQPPGAKQAWDPFDGTLSGFEYVKTSDQSRACAAISFNLVLSGNVVLFVPDAAHSTVRVYDHTLSNNAHSSANGNVTTYPFTEPPSFAPASVISVDHLTTNKYTSIPTAVVRTADQQLYTLSENNNESSRWHWQQLVLPPGTNRGAPLVWAPSNVGQTSSWSTSSNLLNLFVVAGQTLSVIRQVSVDANTDAMAPVFNPAVPLQTGVATAASQARPSSGDELIVVDADGNLEVLTKTSDGGWTASPIHLPATESAQVVTYRLQLTLMDDWDAPVPGRPLQVVASAPAIALVDGRGVTLSDRPTTFTTDPLGQVTIPVVADGLWVPKLTVSGGGLANAVDVWPSQPINHYMSGADTLNYMPTMSGETLASAVRSDGAHVYPLAKQENGTASDAATLLAATATAAAKAVGVDFSTATDAAGARHRSARPGLRPSRRDALTLGVAPPQLGAPVRIDAIELSFSDLAGDALHAIKTGAAKVDHVILSFDNQLGAWVGHLTAEFGAWGARILDVTIKDLEDAAHVFHSVVNHLGALLTDVLDWLKAHVLALLRDTVALARTYEGWMMQAADEVHALIVKAQGRADGFLANEKQEIHASLTELRQLVGSASIDSLSNTPRSEGVLMVATEEPSWPDPNDPGSRWLLQKVTQSSPSATKGVTMSDDLTRLVNDLTAKLEAEGQDFLQAAKAFGNTFTTLVTNPKNFGTVGAGDLIDAIGHVTDAALDLADLLVDLVLDLLKLTIDLFKQIIATPVDGLPLVRSLLQQAGMTGELTIGRLATLVIAFPTALAWKIKERDGSAQLFGGVAPDRVTTEASAKSVAWGASATAMVVSAFDSIAALGTGLTGKAPSDFFTWMDIVGPIVIAGLTVPAHDGGLPFSSPIKLGDRNDALVATDWAMATVPGWLATVRAYASDNPATQANMLNLTSMSGLIGAGFSILTPLVTAPTPHDGKLPALAGFLGSVNPGVGFLLGEEAIGATDGLSAIFVAVAGGVCTDAGAIISYIAADG
jgi:hypothetical protein